MMNLNGRSCARFYAVSLVIAATLFCTSNSSAFGQERSTDRDNPTLLNSNKIDDDLDGSNSEYFYKFAVGPGTLSVIFEVKASGTNAGAILDLFDARSRPILSDVLAQGVDGGSERLVKTIQFSRKQDILMRVKGMKYGDSGGTGSYKITLDGPVSLGPAAAPVGGGAPANNGGAAPAGGAAGAPPAGSNLVQGQLDPADERTLFHVVNVNGPGQVTFSFSVKATDAQAAAKFAVVTEKGNLALSPLDVQGGESISKPVTFDKAQTVIIMVQVTKLPGNAGHGSYSVQLSGPAVAAAPRPAGSNLLSGELNGADERPLFHLVNVNGPGQVTFSISVKATDGKAGAKIAVLMQNGRAAVPLFELQGGESVTKPVTFDKAQTLTILVQGIKSPDNGGGHGTYSIQVSGPVTIIK